MHISSLPSDYGIGTMGKAARDFVDFLAASGQKYWQILPLSPTGYGDSPYQPFSSFAGNPYFIDLEYLENDGLLRKDEYAGIDWGGDPQKVDYGKLYKHRFAVLRKASERLLEHPSEDFSLFCAQNGFWLSDYALFMSLKDRFGGKPWSVWDPGLRNREPSAVDQAKRELSSDISFWEAVQYLFFRQWNGLREYAASRGIEFIGDIPIYVSPDSCEIWSEPERFLMDNSFCPIDVAGCPPDRYSEDGQLWGNPLYDWDNMREDGYSWWIRRIAHQFEIYDVLRIDHFRGFDSYYAIPGGAETARNGEWRKGPGMDLFNALNGALGPRRYIAEDLGYLTDSVRELLKDSGLPGMKVLQFAFDSSEDSDYLPHNYPRNCVAYTGTHDNDTIIGWFSGLSAEDAKKAAEYIRFKEGESLPRAMISTLWASVADLAVATMQDVLELGSEARMNLPGTRQGNWRWRMQKGSPGPETSEWLLRITELYGRR